MKYINDSEYIWKIINRLNAQDLFSEESMNHLRFNIAVYEKNEIIASPDSLMHQVLLIYSGTVFIYGIKADGTLSPVATVGGGKFLGDLEFAIPNDSLLYVQAKSRTVCLSLPFSTSRTILTKDVVFLNYLVRSIAEKLKLFASSTAENLSIEEKVLQYIERDEHHHLEGVLKACSALQCSKRQMQRVLKKLCENGQLKKVSKGKYVKC